MTFDGEKKPLQLHFSPDFALYHPIIREPVKKDAPGAAEIKDKAKVKLKAGAKTQAPEAPPPSVWKGSDAGVHFMQFAVGKGLLTIVSDADIWSSPRIAELDHALPSPINATPGTDAVWHAR